ncbi:carbohydrate sulfotransferase 9 isoform X2 [Patella vulgata]|uniref:carbohydrate sulfotransferase 9 isoform X2 n=1 Tax=Patella vulgata TaxID=6465 RepID=UPI00217F3F99|nr:carbohydrate sulfotransferase 9 isoform X2 [Patella vulgata]
MKQSSMYSSRLFKIKTAKMFDQTVKIGLPLLCIVGLVLFIILKLSPTSIYSVDSIKKIIKINHAKPGPRDRDQIKRHQYVDAVCKNNTLGSTGNILVSSAKKMSYCIVPTAESEFWIRTFRYLNDESKEEIDTRDLTKLNSLLSQNLLRQNLKLYHMEKESDEIVVDATNKILFTRNPYTRLWIAYIEHMFLPDLWNEVGRKIVSFRKSPKQESLLCGNDVTFEEFLDHVLREAKSPANMKKIWRPVQYLCNPCKYKPDFIGKVEYFDVDAKHILQKFDLSILLKSYESENYEIGEMKNIIRHYFHLYNQGTISNCISRAGLALRLWTSFQVRGYLPLQSESALQHITERTFDVNIFREIVVNIYDRYRSSRYLWKNQHNKLTTHAFQEIPFRIFKGLTTVYEFDFKAFGYEMFPKQFLKIPGVPRI